MNKYGNGFLLVRELWYGMWSGLDWRVQMCICVLFLQVLLESSRTSRLIRVNLASQTETWSALGATVIFGATLTSVIEWRGKGAGLKEGEFKTPVRLSIVLTSPVDWLIWRFFFFLGVGTRSSVLPMLKCSTPTQNMCTCYRCVCVCVYMNCDCIWPLA